MPHLHFQYLINMKSLHLGILPPFIGLVEMSSQYIRTVLIYIYLFQDIK